MAKVERYICIRYENIVYELVNCCNGDEQAKRQAVYSLEKRLGKMRGGLQKYFKENPEEIWGVIR